MSRRDRLFVAALRKQFLAERMTREERKEMNRRRLPDGSVPMPFLGPADMVQVPDRLLDPRIKA